MNTTENNKLIAQFMGHKISTFYAFILCDGTYEAVDKFWTNHGNNFEGDIYTTGQNIPFDGLKYHISFEWLMPVVNKCYEYGELDNKHREAIIETFSDTININDTYKEVINFINWYNKKK
jgi:hypothetical protein